MSESYLDGRSKSVTGTAVIEQHTDYAVNPDATRETISYAGVTNSSMYSLNVSDVLGRTIRTERPGFGGVAVTNLSVYNDDGRLVRTQAPGRADTLYEYDALGNQVRSGLDVDDNGSLGLASMDRISDSDTTFEKVGADWFRRSITEIYPSDSDATPTTTSIRKQRLTGLSTNLTQESVAVDIHGNETVSRTAVDAAEKTTTRTTDSPASTNDAVHVSVNGRLQVSESATGVRMTFGYDDLGRQISRTDPTE